ncbi:MAG TPA: hypothetical protein VGN34_27190 [Ktedonobacteraceae bacterium]
MVNKRLWSAIFGVVVLVVAVVLVTRMSGEVAAAAPAPQTVHGYLQTQVVAAGETQGTITQGGWLNGTTQDQISVTSLTGTSYTATFQDVTKSGTLVLQDQGQFFSDGSFTESGTVDATASTGRFAGASGRLTFQGSTSDGVHFTATVSGEIVVAGE